MKKFILLAGMFTFCGINAVADENLYIEQKRAQAAADRAALMQKIQQAQTSPGNFTNNPEAPHTPATSGQSNSISFPGSKNRYLVPATVNGHSIEFLADTGASATVLTQADAKKIGINTDSLKYNKLAIIANGEKVKNAAATIDSLKIGPIQLSDVPVYVMEDNGHQSLLGMTFFNRLSKFTVENNTLTMYK